MAAFDFSIVQYNTGRPLVQVLRGIDGQAVDVVDADSITFAMVAHDDAAATVIMGAGSPDPDVIGQVTRFWGPDELDVEGPYDYQVTVIQDGVRTTYPVEPGRHFFTLEVVKSLIPKNLVPPPPPAPGIRTQYLGTVNDIATLRALPVDGFLPGRTLVVVREVNRMYRLDGDSGQPETEGAIYDSTDPTLQWFVI